MVSLMSDLLTAGLCESWNTRGPQVENIRRDGEVAATRAVSEPMAVEQAPDDSRRERTDGHQAKPHKWQNSQPHWQEESRMTSR